MNKKDKNRNPVPEDPVQGYSMMVCLLASQLGVDKIPEVFHYVEMLVDACTRHTFEQEYKISPKKQIEKNKRQFIVVFRARYLQLSDLEYTRTITGVDAKMIKSASKALTDKGFKVDDYLRWVFEVFLPDNEKFCPPSLKLVCGSFMLDKFFYEHRHKVKEIHEKELHRKEGMGIISRARVLIRDARGREDEQEEEKIKEIMLAYRDKCIMLGEFRQKIEELERQSRESNG